MIYEGGGPIIIEHMWFESFSIYSLMSIDRIQCNIRDDRLLLYAHIYGFRVEMNPFLV